jgi:hypothetical protein
MLRITFQNVEGMPSRAGIISVTAWSAEWGNFFG